MSQQLNVFGRPLAHCSLDPVTGFFRTGCCDTGAEDRGNHTVCVLLTEQFLEFSYDQGNDLISPAPQYGFPGLLPGMQWCVCASRWYEAHLVGCAAPLHLEATNIRVLETIPLDVLLQYSSK
jgi:uncharacterized protein